MIAYCNIIQLLECIQVINNFGNENISHIENDKVFLDKCIRNLTSFGMKDLIEKIHFDPEHPENNNVRIKSLRNDFFEVYKDNKWNIMDKNETLDSMIKKSNKMIRNFYDDNKNTIKKYDNDA